MKEYLKFLKETYKEYEKIPTATKDMIKIIQDIKEKFMADLKEKSEKLMVSHKSKME